jgi:cytochrome c553
MKKTNMIIVSAAALFALSGCGDAPESSSEAKTYSKTPAEVYEQSCKKCHGDNGEGNVKKKGPAMNDRQAEELELDLFDVKNGGLNQSSGTDHDVMEHNMQKLLAKGYDYDPKAMAIFLEKSFYKMPPKTAAPAAEEAPAAEATAAPAAEATPAAAH